MVRSKRRSLRTLRDYGIALLKRLDAMFAHSTHSLDEEGPEEMYGEGLFHNNHSSNYREW